MNRHDDEMPGEMQDGEHDDDMLGEAAWLNEQGLGYPLNMMYTLYYETTLDEPLPSPSEGDSAQPEQSL